jgi:hypothetical protein
MALKFSVGGVWRFGDTMLRFPFTACPTSVHSTSRKHRAQVPMAYSVERESLCPVTHGSRQLTETTRNAHLHHKASMNHTQFERRTFTQKFPRAQFLRSIIHLLPHPYQCIKEKIDHYPVEGMKQGREREKWGCRKSDSFHSRKRSESGRRERLDQLLTCLKTTRESAHEPKLLASLRGFGPAVGALNHPVHHTAGA